MRHRLSCWIVLAMSIVAFPTFQLAMGQETPQKIDNEKSLLVDPSVVTHQSKEEVRSAYIDGNGPIGCC